VRASIIVLWRGPDHLKVIPPTLPVEKFLLRIDLGNITGAEFTCRWRHCIQFRL